MKDITNNQINKRLAEFDGYETHIDASGRLRIWQQSEYANNCVLQLEPEDYHTESLASSFTLLETLGEYWGANIWKDEKNSYYCRLDHITSENETYFISRKMSTPAKALATVIYKRLEGIDERTK